MRIKQVGYAVIASVAGMALCSPASAQLAGQCRAAKHSTPIFSDQAATSPALRLLSTNTQVTLAEEDVNPDFIRVSSPASGYVYKVNLKNCSSAQNPGTPPDGGSRCRQVVFPREGLLIRTEPSASAALANPPGVAYLQRVTLTSSPATSQRGADGRVWVKIESPANGWVSNGFPGQGVNLGNCP